MCAAAVALLPDQVPIPFHVAWVGLALVYGVRMWPLGWTVVGVLGTAMLTGAALTVSIANGRADADEYAEIPLMALLFFVLVWHTRRRQAALEETARLAEERRRGLQREQDFLRDASHQLRTPITIARGHADLLVGELDGAARADAEVVLEELAALGRITERMLLLQAAERPEFLVLSEVAPETLLQRVSRRWAATADRIWTTEAEAPGHLFADAERLTSALDAVIENAVAFTAPGDQIRLTVHGADGQALFVVEDSGPGLSRAAADQVFERFWSDGTARREGRGTGLGLAIVRAVVGAHGGQVAALTGDLGGLRLELRLPAYAEPDQERDVVSSSSNRT